MVRASSGKSAGRHKSAGQRATAQKPDQHAAKPQEDQCTDREAADLNLVLADAPARGDLAADKQRAAAWILQRRFAQEAVDAGERWLGGTARKGKPGARAKCAAGAFISCAAACLSSG